MFGSGVIIGKSVMSSLMVPLVAVALIVLAGSAVYITNTLKSAGRTEAEFDRLTDITVRNVSNTQRMEKFLKTSIVRTKEYEQLIAKLQTRLNEQVKQIQSIPKSSTNICPIDCVLPEILR